MFSRRDFLQVAAATAAIVPGGWSQAFAQQRLTQDELLRFDPNGRLERAIRVPPRYPTMPAFGGEDLATLFFTSASYPIPETERGAYPEAGGLFAMEAPVPGLPPDYFQPNGNGHPQ